MPLCLRVRTGLSFSPLKFSPDSAVVLFPVAPVKGRLVGNDALHRTIRHGVVRNGSTYDAAIHILNVVPLGTGETDTWGKIEGSGLERAEDRGVRP